MKIVGRFDGHNWVEFEAYFEGIAENGEKIAENHIIQTVQSSQCKLVKEYGRHYYNEMVWGDKYKERHVKPMHIEVDGVVAYHVGARDGGTGRKVCKI